MLIKIATRLYIQRLVDELSAYIVTNINKLTSNSEYHAISRDKIQTIIKELPIGKSASIQGVTNEMIKYADSDQL